MEENSIISSTTVESGSTWEIEKEAELNGVNSDMIGNLDTLVLTGGLHEQLENYLASGNNLVINDADEDNAGKTAEYDLAYQGEFDLGVKVEREHWLENEHKTSWYVKPSFVQTTVAGDEVAVTGLDAIESLNNETLLRLLLGGYYDLQHGLSINAEGAYTANSEYKNLSVNFGLRYEF